MIPAVQIKKPNQILVYLFWSEHSAKVADLQYNLTTHCNAMLCELGDRLFSAKRLCVERIIRGSTVSLDPWRTRSTNYIGLKCLKQKTHCLIGN